jgi:hypothetical protein
LEHEDHGGKQDQLEEHSLPGTNQAGEGPGACENDDEAAAGGDASQQQDQLEEHSLPGTNQAGKGPDPT